MLLFVVIVWFWWISVFVSQRGIVWRSCNILDLKRRRKAHPRGNTQIFIFPEPCEAIKWQNKFANTRDKPFLTLDSDQSCQWNHAWKYLFGIRTLSSWFLGLYPNCFFSFDPLKYLFSIWIWIRHLGGKGFFGTWLDFWQTTKAFFV